MTQPFCRCCGTPIAKRGRNVWVETNRSITATATSFSRYVHVDQRPKTVEECARLTNWQIISVRRDSDRAIRQFTEWDGESYKDKHFCTNRCAIDFAWAIAENTNYSTAAYRKARDKVRRS